MVSDCVPEIEQRILSQLIPTKLKRANCLERYNRSKEVTKCIYV